MSWRLNRCYVFGHAWHQPEGVFTPMLCRRCGADRWLMEQMERRNARLTREATDG